MRYDGALSKFHPAHCGRWLCTCDHRACFKGWHDQLPPRRHNGTTYEQTAPCAACRPDAYNRLAVWTERNSGPADDPHPCETCGGIDSHHPECEAVAPPPDQYADDQLSLLDTDDVTGGPP